MLEEWKFDRKKLDEAECKVRLKARRLDLAGLQQPIKGAGLPVIVLIEGWGASGKGSMIRSLIRELDPRGFLVRSVTMPTQEERRWPFLKRHFEAIPEQGKILFLDSGWMDETVRERLRGDLSDGEYQRRLESVNLFERQLAAGGYLLVKLFLHIEQDTQRKRLEKLEKHKDTAWRAGENDWRQNKNYHRTQAAFDDFMQATHTDWAPWKVIDATSGPCAQLAAADWLYQQITAALRCPPTAEPPVHRWPLVDIQPLEKVKLDKSLDKDKYQRELEACREKLEDLHNQLYRKKIPVVIAYEGWDAAGKGGNIKRLASALDPRGYEVVPIASPTSDEKHRHYLWRFWRKLPKTGHIAIFDRSWYGRVMVERLEGFCTLEDWQRAYDEINEFERELTDAGAVVLKFWVQIDKDTQLQRFQARENTPEKRWKITDEDWRNREKWDAYQVAVNEMLARTNTENAPWHILESVDKRYARIKAMKIVIHALEQALD